MRMLLGLITKVKNQMLNESQNQKSGFFNQARLYRSNSNKPVAAVSFPLFGVMSSPSASSL